MIKWSAGTLTQWAEGLEHWNIILKIYSNKQSYGKKQKCLDRTLTNSGAKGPKHYI